MLAKFFMCSLWMYTLLHARNFVAKFCGSRDIRQTTENLSCDNLFGQLVQVAVAVRRAPARYCLDATCCCHRRFRGNLKCRNGENGSCQWSRYLQIFCRIRKKRRETKIPVCLRRNPPTHLPRPIFRRVTSCCCCHFRSSSQCGIVYYNLNKPLFLLITTMPYTVSAYVRFRVSPQSQWEIGTYIGEQKYSNKVISFFYSTIIII